MLPRQDETDVAVTWEDQKMINEFSWLNTRMHELKDEREELQEEVNKLDDASTELMLGSFDTPARFLIGEVYVEMDAASADERLSREKQQIEKRFAEIDAELDSINKQMTRLKVSLYSKFKNSINLDE